MTNPGERSGQRTIWLLLGLGLFIVTIVVAGLSFPNFTLFLNQDALPVITQIMWYTFIMLMGAMIGHGINWRAPYNAVITKDFHRYAPRKIVHSRNLKRGAPVNPDAHTNRRH